LFVTPTADPIVARAWEDVHNAENGPQQARVVRRLRSPISWFGGKGMLVPRLLPLIPPHHTYCEPFGGGASLLVAKPPSPVEVYNDINSDLVNFFRVLRDPCKFEQFYQLAKLTPYSREEFNRFRSDWRSGWSSCPDDVVRAYRWYVVARMSFSGEFGRSWGYSVATSRWGMANAVSQWLSIIDMLPAISDRVKRVQIEHGDWHAILERYDSPDTLFYVDPPFVKATRRSGRYVHEMEDEAHENLVKALRNIQGKVLLSGYRHNIYRPLEEDGWECVDLPTTCYAVGRTRRTSLRGGGSLTRYSNQHLRTETIWISSTAHTLAIGQDPGQYVQGRLSLEIAV
jgi:DNA adenine methylase